MSDAELCLLIILLLLQIGCIYCFCVFFYRRFNQFVDYCRNRNIYSKRKFSIYTPVISVLVYLALIVLMYHRKLTNEFSSLIEMWIPVLILYIMVIMIVRNWREIADNE